MVRSEVGVRVILLGGALLLSGCFTMLGHPARQLTGLSRSIEPGAGECVGCHSEMDLMLMAGPTGLAPAAWRGYYATPWWGHHPGPGLPSGGAPPSQSEVPVSERERNAWGRGGRDVRLPGVGAGGGVATPAPPLPAPVETDPVVTPPPPPPPPPRPEPEKSRTQEEERRAWKR